MERISPEWLADIAMTGRWDEPAFWRSEAYAASCPFSREAIDRAFQWLRRVYPPRVAKKCLGNRENPISQLLVDIHSAHLSDLLSLGLDGIVANPPERLVKRLRNPNNYVGARQELEVMAGLAAAGIPFAFESRKGADDNHDPDFLLPGLGDGLYVDVKNLGASDLYREARTIAQALTGVARESFYWPRRPTTIRFSDTLDALMASRDGMSILRPQVDALRARVGAARQRAETKPTTTRERIDDLVEIEVGEPIEQGLTGRFDMPPCDPDYESRRVLQSLQTGAEQIPPGHNGAVLIDVDASPNPSGAPAAIAAWLNHPTEDGAHYAHVLGALLVSGRWSEDGFARFLDVVPIWRRVAPDTYRDRDFWMRFTNGLNWQRIARWRWQRAQMSLAPSSP